MTRGWAFITFLAACGLLFRLSPTLPIAAENRYAQFANGKLGALHYECDTLELNTATAAQLAELPDIGAKTAEEIVDARELLRGFRNLDEFRGVNRRIFREYWGMIRFLTIDSTKAPTDLSARRVQLTEKLPLNLVTAEQLVEAKLTTRALAERIVKKRDKRKGFRSFDELNQIDGVGHFFANLKANTFILFAPTTIDLNAATFDELVDLPGLGPVTAQTILNFRQSFGSFSSVEQLDDLKGFGPAKMEKLRPLLRVDAKNVRQRKFYINRATLADLIACPFINDAQIAADIVKTRQALGNFKSYADLFWVKNWKRKQKEKLSPYLSFD